MEIKKILNKWTIASFIIGNILAFIIAKLVMDSFFAGIIFSLLFVAIILVHSLIHSFAYLKLKEKMLISFLDVIPLVSYMVILGSLEKDYSEVLIGILILYFPAAIIITFLSWSLTYLWKRYKR